jgi:cathepsin A (carboxypeptidase C)
MKFDTVAILCLLLPLSLSRSLERDTLDKIRKGRSDAQSNCHDIHDQKTCSATKDGESDDSCVWCECAAVPSVCVTRDESTGLPPGVFSCDSSQSSDGDNGRTIYDFGLQNGRIIQLRETVREKGDEQVFCDNSSISISGYMDVKGSKYDESGNKHLFFWMFEKRSKEEEENQDEIPFVVWLTGGPGCSSTLALLTENGPCSVNKDGKGTSVNPYSWTEAAHVLWLDQPAGVGFSYGDENDSGEEMIGEDAYYFFQAFFKSHPDYAKNPLYIIGESYGGHYVPAISHRIWKGNKSPCEKCEQINFAGLAIGNGLTAPEEQYKWYPEMVWNNSHHIKVVDEGVYDAMKKAVPACTKLIHQCESGDNTLDNFACQAAFITCNMALTSPYQATGLNPYDIRKKCEVPPLCYDFSFVKDWLNLESTKKALNVDENHSHSWEACNFGINMKFHVDWMKDFSHLVADLLNDGYPCLIYAGDVDFICNYLGNEAWTKSFEWHGKDAFNAAEVHEWGDGAGLARSSSGLTFLQVVDGGHMVPSDQPEVSLTMLESFLNGTQF